MHLHSVQYNKQTTEPRPSVASYLFNVTIRGVIDLYRLPSPPNQNKFKSYVPFHWWGDCLCVPYIFARASLSVCVSVITFCGLYVGKKKHFPFIFHNEWCMPYRQLHTHLLPIYIYILYTHRERYGSNLNHPPPRYSSVILCLLGRRVGHILTKTMPYIQLCGYSWQTYVHTRIQFTQLETEPRIYIL